MEGENGLVTIEEMNKINEAYHKMLSLITEVVFNIDKVHIKLFGRQINGGFISNVCSFSVAKDGKHIIAHFDSDEWMTYEFPVEYINYDYKRILKQEKIKHRIKLEKIKKEKDRERESRQRSRKELYLKLKKEFEG